MGNQKLSKIATNLELKQTGLTKYLKTLINLDILEREVPITEDNPEKSKRGLYKIKDNFILFWFKFIYPNISYIESGNEELAMKKIRQNLVDNHISYVYEDICREEMWELNAKGKWNFHFDKVGRWWNGNTEIDLVAIDSTGIDIIFGECKYWKNKVGIDVFEELEKKAKSVEWNATRRKCHFVIFSISGFTDDLIKLSEEREELLLI
jgi:AAA+ ATPase superfamily predicted ATPase